MEGLMNKLLDYVVNEWIVELNVPIDWLISEWMDEWIS